MSGPVWRLAPDTATTCDLCLRHVHGVYLEGEVVDNALAPTRHVCPECYGQSARLIVVGELGSRQPSPAYAREP